MFGNNPTGWIGTDHFLLINQQPIDYSWMFFQCMFAATAATIVSGAIAERTQFWPYILGSIIITGFIYTIYGSWAWGSLYKGSGWLKKGLYRFCRLLRCSFDWWLVRSRCDHHRKTTLGTICARWNASHNSGAQPHFSCSWRLYFMARLVWF